MKSHFQVESSNSRVSIKTLNFTRVLTFYQRDWSWITGDGAGGSPTGPRRCSWPMRRPHRSIDIASSGAPKTSQNGRGKWLQGERDQGSAMADRPRMAGWGMQPAPVGRRWTVSRHRGRMGMQNCRQWPGIQRRGTCVETQAGNATGGLDRRPAAGYGRPQAHCWMQLDDWPTSRAVGTFDVCSM